MQREVIETRWIVAAIAVVFYALSYWLSQQFLKLALDQAFDRQPEHEFRLVRVDTDGSEQVVKQRGLTPAQLQFVEQELDKVAPGKAAS